MLRVVTSTRVALAIGVAALTAGCVAPATVIPGPIQLQQYPPAVSYQSTPDYRPAISGPIPLQPAPQIEPLPPATPAPAVTEVPATDLGGAIPVQDMPAPTAGAASATPGSDASDSDKPDPATAPPTQIVRKTPSTGPGNNVPLEGFRPMHGQTRVAP